MCLRLQGLDELRTSQSETGRRTHDNSLAEKDLGFLVEEKLDMSQ